MIEKKAIVFGLVLLLFVSVSGAGAVPINKPKISPNYPFLLQITPSKNTVKPGSPLTFNVSLDVGPVGELTRSEYKRRWASWFIVDSNNNVIQKGDWQEIDHKYEKEVSVNAPSSPEKYVFVSLIRENYFVYTSNGWTLDSKKTIAKESQKFTVKPEAPQPSPPVLSQILQNIINWLKGLFG